MNTLVTGAMGQVGKRVVEILLSRGRTVIALDIETPTTTHVLEGLQDCETATGVLIPVFVDLTDANAVDRCLNKYCPDAIVHLAAIVSPPCYRNPALAHQVNVIGTRNLVEAARRLVAAPLFIEASSSAVYGSRNPHSHPERIDSSTPVNPIDCYGKNKVLAEQIVANSGLPYALLRLGGVISPDAIGTMNADYLLLMRATPRDNRVHVVDARDAALAFANAVDRGPLINGKVLLIGGNDSCVLTQEQVQDDVMEAMGLGRLGPKAGLPGNPTDDDGWGLTDWFDTEETQALLEFQNHDWKDTVAWVASSSGSPGRAVKMVSPLIRVLLRSFLVAQRRWSTAVVMQPRGG